MRPIFLRTIASSTSFKLISAIVSLITVPFLLKALGTNDYAVWVTTTALVAWLNLFDFGSGYSLKNKVTEGIATNNYAELNTLISGTLQFYILMGAFALVIFVGSLFSILVFKRNVMLALIIYLPVIFSFPLTLGSFIIQGRKKFNEFNVLLLIQSICWLVVILVFKYGFFHISIYKLAAFYSLFFCITKMFILVISLKGLSFKWREIFNIKNFFASKQLLKTGYRFFLLQISSLFLFSLGNILTYSHLTLNNVAEYDTVNKVYMMGMTLFNVVISVYWAEISHAKALKNQKELWKLYKQLLIIALGFSLGTGIFTLFIPHIIKIWTNNLIKVEVIQLVPFSLLICFQAIAYAGAVILNAFEELKGQILLSILASILMIPLSNLFFDMHIGIGSVPLATLLLTVPTVIFVLLRAKSIIFNMEGRKVI